MFHGKSGPVNAKLVPNPNRLNYAFMDALGELQFPACPDFNGPNPEGYGRRQGLIRDGQRESTAKTMLRPMVRARQCPPADRCAGGAGAWSSNGRADRRRS